MADLEAEKRLFLRYADTDTNAHSLPVWRTESHDEATVCRLGFALGSDKRTDISWLGTAADDNLDTVTGMTVYLPKQTDLAGTLAYTTRAADGTETEHTQPLAGTGANQGRKRRHAGHPAGDRPHRGRYAAAA